MRKTKKISPLLRIIIGTVAGLVISVLNISAFAFLLSKKDFAEYYLLVFLLVSAFSGAFFASLFTASGFKQRRFIIALTEGLGESFLSVLAVSAVNVFSVTPFIYLIIACGTVAGTVAGVISINIK